MNDNQPITAEEHERFERFTSHQARFQERRILVGFCPLDGAAFRIKWRDETDDEGVTW
jgi:hypothetical protein